MSARKLSVRMFGGFSANYGEEALVFGKQTNARFRQLFQVLMTRPGEGFGKQSVAQSIYEPGEVEDLNASLNNTIFRLRKYLEESPLPAGEYLKIKDGIIRFDGPVEAESDAGNFEKLSQEFKRETDAQKKRRICEQACEIYRGEFLPQLSNELWVIQKNKEYQKKYAAMLRCLLESMKSEGDYAGIEERARQGIRLGDSEEWYLWLIESLNAQGRMQDALSAYRDAQKSLLEMGSVPSGKKMRQLEEIGKKLKASDRGPEGIAKYLAEDCLSGAYGHTFPGFIDLYRILKCLEARGSISCLLILCTIRETEENFADKKKDFQRQENKLLEIFKQKLRRGDVYAKYGENQYVLLCVGAAEKDFSEIIMRIDADFQRRCHGRYAVRCRILD